jgi:hypothetical protein
LVGLLRQQLSLSFFHVVPTWSIGHPRNASFHFSFLNFGQSVGLLGRGISPSQGLYLHKQNKRIHVSIPCVTSWKGDQPVARPLPTQTQNKRIHVSIPWVTPWKGDQPVARPLPTHRTTQAQNKGTQTFMPQVGFEPTIPVFEPVKTVHVLDRAATVFGILRYSLFSFIIIRSGVRLSPLGTAATTGLLYQLRMIDDKCGAVGGMRIGKGNRSTWRKLAPVPLCPPQIPHDQTRTP